MGLAVLLAVGSVPWLNRLGSQIALMMPWVDPIGEKRNEAMQLAYERDPPPETAEAALYAAARPHRARLNLTALRRRDEGNGLYNWLDLLGDLPPVTKPAASRPAGGGVASVKPSVQSRPAEGGITPTRLSEVAGGAPVRLYADRRYTDMMEVLGSMGVSGREAAREARTANVHYSYLCRSVLRGLADGLMRQGSMWREAGRPQDAVVAHAAVVRLMLQVVSDSPAPEVVLLAVEYAPAALREIAREAPAAGLPGAVAEQCTAAALQVESLRWEWHHPPGGDAVNVLPYMPDFVLAEAAHDRAMGSMLAALIGAGTWAWLAGVCVLLMPWAVRGWQSGVAVRWRWNGRGRWLAAVVVAGPMMVLMALSLTARVPFTWLVSMPSLYGVVLLGLLTPVLVGLATWLCVEFPLEWSRARRSGKVVLVITAIALLVLVMAVRLMVRLDSPWSPAGVRVIRWTGFVIGLESAVVMAVWLLWGFVRRRRSRLAAGPMAGANLAVAAVGWAVAAAVMSGALGLNIRIDARHEEAFARAAADPVGDRLGPEWFARHFEKAQQVLGLIGR